MNQDVRIINSSNSFGDAINTLIKQLRIPESFTKEDFLKDYRNDFLRLILYLVIFKNEAKDWINQDIRIGYYRSDNQLNEGFKTDKKYWRIDNYEEFMDKRSENLAKEATNFLEVLKKENA